MPSRLVARKCVRRAAAFLVLTCTWSLAAAEPQTSKLPSFTEEREAAALHFVNKHLKDLTPLLERLKKSQPAQYQREICEIFQVTEWLADLRDDMTRHDLELSIWINENKAYLLIAKLSTPSADERKKIEGQLQELAKELVDLDIQVLGAKITSLKQELAETEEELGRAMQNRDKQAAERYEELLKKLKKK